MHATVLVDPAREAELDAAEAVGEELFALVVSLGGSIAGEHGVGWLKRGRLAGAVAPSGRSQLHEQIKRAFDPKGLLNPGKKLARYPACAAPVDNCHHERKHAMNKSQLIDAVASDSGLTKADSARAIESLLDTVTRTLKKGDEVAHHGLRQVLGRQTRRPPGRQPAHRRARQNQSFQGAQVLRRRRRSSRP